MNHSLVLFYVEAFKICLMAGKALVLSQRLLIIRTDVTAARQWGIIWVLPSDNRVGRLQNQRCC